MSTLPDRTTALLAAPTLEGLAYALRHREVWPEGFEWDYSLCETCAIGMARELWDSTRNLDLPDIFNISVMFNISVDTAFDIFVWLGLDSTCATITPDYVAAAIDRYLAGEKPVA